MIKERYFRSISITIALFLFAFIGVFAQVSHYADTTSLMIGDQIKFEIKVKTDSLNTVVFPEGQTFTPLELVEANSIDTVKDKGVITYSKIYHLTQFDSGSYTIPKQKIVIGNQVFFTDTLKTQFNAVAVDTTKQKLYEIKPKVRVSKSYPKLLKQLGLLAISLIVLGVLLYIFLFRKKSLTKEEQLALLPSYDRAKLAIKSINQEDYISANNVKGYYSDLTFALKKYVDEKVFSKALECTTEEFIFKLKATQKSGDINLSKSAITSLESVLKRADLVKFAKSIPDVTVLESDKSSVDNKIDEIKAGLPEPSEEEKLKNIEYKKQVELKRKRRLRLNIAAASFMVFVWVFVIHGFLNGFQFTIDKIFQNTSLKQLQKEWVYSEYGVPSIQILTPNVLQRDTNSLVDSLKNNVQITSFRYGELHDAYSIRLTTKVIPESKGKAEDVDLLQTGENIIQIYESKGATDIFIKQEQYITPNAAEGLKTFGTMNIPEGEKFVYINYSILQFTSANLLQQIELTYRDDDVYAKQIVDKIIESIELNKKE